MDYAPPLPRERYKHLRDPELRRKSYKKWPSGTSDTLFRELIDEGFFSIDEEKRKVQCVYCGGVLVGIEEGQNVHITHYRHFPTCDRFKWREADFESLFGPIHGIVSGVHNLSMAGSATANGVSLDSTDEGYQSIQKDLEVDGFNSNSYLDGRQRDSSNPFYTIGEEKYPRHTYYALFIDRMKTFKKWPEDSCQTPKALAGAGLFYTGVEDVCECYCCGGQLEGWEPGDIPQTEHDTWFGDKCPLTLAMKGKLPTT
ncbi:baculoviral IAP repeat-containing protein 7-like [Mizuhopecten yessoensis]|uniref:E3 ubiquitin-protein ligase XIAP n=1 Tax=Mizuhopecten yessoensis TaxID=6573 RepID=A0A210R5X3_MIZYE|nr:baculoviral IAP repeat-containing protein 7-like [Mizuhopecten yessoensis]XP_021348832.1 baculoviral IAP repeat-containing protein 7-like [Mizuhopecten yessoensis]XP_021348839.1 baculoviral IAP repeat-containing protein 7-like [Mizuhopecten yessoensis]XP_021348846.1 baculoviral IAP repeat-containing protein 7-like [Mizuhopecten yessoensis]XP_021348855.1 baculoviral IAP repeat-containing protein 7-like [Mizuhopecten yessoensis]XP_021348864.1 baculoviral IAP repeat-containing protein 7-like [